MFYKSCEILERGIHFYNDSISVCCHSSGVNDKYIFLVRYYNGEKIDWPKIIAYKNKLRDDCKNGIYLDACKNCSRLEERDWEDGDHINYLVISHWTKCNCNCTYCYTEDNKNYYNTKENYKLLPILEDMIEQNILKFDNIVLFGGGEPAILDELDDILNLFIEHKTPCIHMNSSGILYNETIAKALSNNQLSLVISVDSGCPETYKKIKQVDCYNKVWENIKKYKQAQGENIDNVTTKYIIIPGVNDNIEEVELWMQTCVKENFKTIILDIECHWYAKNKNNIPESIYNLISYIQNRAKELDLNIWYYSIMEELIKKEHEDKAVAMLETKPKKKYYSCDLIEHGLDTHVNSINFCCRSSAHGGGFKALIENYNGEQIDWDAFFEIKNKYRKQMQDGDIIPECKNCVYLVEKEWDDENYISYINFNNGLTCNSDCIYCNLKESTPHFKPYPLLPIIKDMIDKEVLRPGGHITMAGGEPTTTEEFEELLNTLLDYGIDAIRVLTNGFIYSKALEKGLRSGAVTTSISVDSGTEETFKKIKRKDTYHAVWENLKKYSLAKSNKNAVKTKYIIIPGVNDNYAEIDAFIQKTMEATINAIAVDVEQFWFCDNQNNIPQHIYELLDYIIKKAEENNLSVEKIDRATMLLNRKQMANNSAN